MTVDMTVVLTTWRRLRYGIVVGMVVIVGVIILVFAMHSGSDVSASQSLAIVSVYVTLAVSLASFALKWSTEDRNYLLRQQAEDRQKLEVAVRTVSLLSTDEGRDVSGSKQAGALFTLAKLGHLDLAIMLVDQLLRAGGLPGGTAALVLQKALEEDCDADLQALAAVFALRHSHALGSPPDGMYWPGKG